MIVRRNGGAAGVDGVTGSRMSKRRAWSGGLGELSRDLRDGTYKPESGATGAHSEEAAGEVPSPGHTVPEGSGCADVGDAGAWSRYSRRTCSRSSTRYRPGRSAKDAVQADPWVAAHGAHREVVDADLSNYFGEIPHAELMKSVARRVSDGRMLGLIKAWLEMPVMEEDGKGGTRRTNRARKERKGTPQGSPDFAAVEQHLHAALHPWLEGAGLRPALRCGDRELRGRLLCSREDPGGRDAGGGQPAHGEAEATDQRSGRPDASDAPRSLSSSLDIASAGATARRMRVATSALDRARRAFRAYAAGSGRKRTHGTRAGQQRRS